MHHAIRAALVVAALLGSGVAAAAGPEDDRRAAPAPRTSAPGVTVQTQFIPIDPCRIADTRSSTAGIIKAKEARDLLVTGTAGFPAQGGTAGGCGIPAGAKAVAVSLTTAASQAAGNLIVYAKGSPKPKAIALAYTTAPTSNEVTARLGTKGRIKVYATKQTHVLADVVGYYAEPIAVFVSGGGSIISRSSQVVSVTRVSAGVYHVFFNTPTLNCVASATASNSNITIAAFTDFYADHVEVLTFNSSGGATDAWFFLTVTC